MYDRAAEIGNLEGFFSGTDSFQKGGPIVLPWARVAESPLFQ